MRHQYESSSDVARFIEGPTNATAHDYRPPSQDGPSASSHNTEVPSFATVAMFDRDPPILGALAALKSRKGAEAELVLRIVLSGPINDV